MPTTFELLRKYDVAGPRYTSYPTVPAWTEAVGAKDYGAALASVRADENLSLYFHLPFCERLCHFCGCFKIITKDHSRSLPYVETLLEEIGLVTRLLKNSERRVSQIHFGGGTPNFISPSELSRIMARVRSEFAVRPDAEIAVEMHPRTSTKEFCENLKREGFNRISLGVQDFDDEVQKLIHRDQTYEMTRDMVDNLRGLGFSSFNFDLIYGLPGQTAEKFARTLDLTLTLDPDRLAVYSYAHVPWKSPVQRSFADSDLPTPEAKLELCERAHAFFTAHGYRQIGMDHFAKPGDELYEAFARGGLHRNFMGYSTRSDAHQIGLGVSSISYAGGDYFQNAKTVEAYEASVHAGNLSTLRGYRLNADDRIRRDLITGIMCRMRVDKDAFGAQHGLVFDEYFRDDQLLLKGLVEDGLVDITPKVLTVTETGKLFLRNVAMAFDAHLETIRRNAKNPVFSRTV